MGIVALGRSVECPPQVVRGIRWRNGYCMPPPFLLEESHCRHRGELGGPCHLENQCRQVHLAIWQLAKPDYVYLCTFTHRDLILSFQLCTPAPIWPPDSFSGTDVGSGQPASLRRAYTSGYLRRLSDFDS